MADEQDSDTVRTVEGVKRSTLYNVIAVVAFCAAVILYYLNYAWPTIGCVVLGAACAILAGSAMQHEPRTPSDPTADE